MHLTPEEQAVGKGNFHAAITSKVTRRDFIKEGAAAAVMSGVGVGAMYFGYDKTIGNPLRVGVIGTGDEGNVLLGAVNPDYISVVAIADIRPFNIHRAFHGDHSSPTALKARPGLLTKYGWTSEDEGRKHVKVYNKDYHDLINDPNVEAVIIALPLWLHARVAVEAMRAGKDVLTEKLMGHSVAECKEMARVADETHKHLATGHQRHYSILYDNAVNLIRRGVIGEVHSIRAQWHRDNLPAKDSWKPPLPNELDKEIKELEEQLAAVRGAKIDKFDKRVEKLVKEFHASLEEQAASYEKRLAQLRKQAEDGGVDAKAHGYQTKQIGKSYIVSPLEELIRWRLFERTGGGLMAELGSHQLDAAGILISAMNPAGGKALPLSVSAVGGRYLFPTDRECEDHVYCVFEFPHPTKHDDDPDKKVGVAYSSINGNGFGGYGEVVMGTEGTLILEREQEALLFKSSATTTKVTVKEKKGGGAALDTTTSGPPTAAASAKPAAELGPVSRGYTEEIEHWAWCIRNRSAENKPRCHPAVALGDAVIALTTNIALRKGQRVEFKKEWFDYLSDETPEGVAPNLNQDKYKKA